MTTANYDDAAILARGDRMTVRNVDALLALPVALRGAAYAEARYAMNMTALRPSDALAQAIRTVRDHGGRPATR